MATENAGCKSYYSFIPCCGGTPVKFCRVEGTSLVDGSTYRYDGPSLVGADNEVLISGQCYTVDIINTYSYYPFSTLYDEIENGSFIRADVEQACDDIEVCPTCPKKVVVYRCCGGSAIQFAYNPAYPTSTTNAYIYLGLSLVFGDGGVLQPNDCFRVEIVNTTQEEADSLPPGPPILQIELAGKACGNYQTGIECAPCNYFYQLVNCADDKEIYCTTVNLSGYINNQITDETLWPVIQISQHPDKCFYVEQISACSSPIPVTVTNNFIGCFACQQTVIQYYKLEDCNNPQVVVFTSTDLSEYVGHVITLEQYQGDCFYVSVYDGLVPADTPVDPKDTFATCKECALPRYLLEDCSGVEENVITQTDLSSYIGQVITLSTCPNVCWIVSETDINTPVVDVYFEAEFIDCPTCLVAVKPCVCSTVENNSGRQRSFTYLDCTGQQVTIELPAYATSEKYCIIEWVTEIGAVKYYGDCVNNTCPTPVVPRPKRKVTPGYDTPACTPEYYENVECHFSEWMYKDVLEKRYGIANCCPEDLIRWELKHEMLMLDSLINPDYTCADTTSCCSPIVTSCNSCGCNTSNCNC